MLPPIVSLASISEFYTNTEIYIEDASGEGTGARNNTHTEIYIEDASGEGTGARNHREINTASNANRT